MNLIKKYNMILWIFLKIIKYILELILQDLEVQEF